ncbi:aldo/keto reductase [Collinsella ihumii]|uniref:Aldo/keto reductase n=1 Tax=Collinsella ihumii TaxID=1720204 RepID=A0AAW7K2J2_9ACTN|nr:aldo/keto reductase [Collinsella ihumii]MDN0069806.1 aldo/keto reductase [Collinsella ihumii]
MVDQFERHPMYQERELTEYCKSHDILPEAYTPFARMDERLLSDERLNEVARHHGKHSTQVILRWNYQSGIASIPKTSLLERMLEKLRYLTSSSPAGTWRRSTRWGHLGVSRPRKLRLRQTVRRTRNGRD